MKVLWITNILLPEAVSLLTGEAEFKGSGGWMIGASNALIEMDDVELSIATPSSLVKDLRIVSGRKIKYLIFPIRNSLECYDKKLEFFLYEINELVKPDVVHIHGTEFPHGLAFVRACGNKNVVASIQGLVSEIWKYKTSGINQMEIVKNLTVSDLLLRKSLFHGIENLKKRGLSEIKLISSLNYIIGRTTWDKSHTWAISPNAKYFVCNEILRDEFYSGRWSRNKCMKHTIFCNQPTNSIKGFHQLIKAMPLVLKHFPDTKVRLSGSNGLYPSTLKGKFLESGYTRYLRRLIDNENLSHAFEFLGPLSADEMKNEYLSANVFVCCSSIENSSNSIGEAQLLGTPCVSSYAGGAADLIEDGKTGFLYRFEEIDMLAYNICKIFSNAVDVEQMSSLEVETANARHNPTSNTQELYNIYQSILKHE